MSKQDIKLSFEKGVATEEDMVKLFSKALEAIKAVKGQLEEKITTNHGAISGTTQSLLDELKTLQDRVDGLTKEIPQTKEKMTGEMDNVVVQIYKEVKRIEQLIPTLQDLASIEAKIKEVEGKIPTLEKITAKKVRDKLETLEGEERLDVSAVKEAPRMTVSLSAPENPEVGDLWGKS